MAHHMLFTNLGHFSLFSFFPLSCLNMVSASTKTVICVSASSIVSSPLFDTAVEVKSMKPASCVKPWKLKALTKEVENFNLLALTETGGDVANGMVLSQVARTITLFFWTCDHRKRTGHGQRKYWRKWALRSTRTRVLETRVPWDLVGWGSEHPRWHHARWSRQTWSRWWSSYTKVCVASWTSDQVALNVVYKTNAAQVFRVCTGPWNPWKCLNFVSSFSRPWKCLTFFKRLWKPLEGLDVHT